MRRLLLAALAAALVAPAEAGAADPIMPLAEVQSGMRCSGLSVVRGTTIASFDVEVLDVIDRRRPEAARILIRVSGPAVDATGIGPGFSGSPIYCRDGAGVSRNIGAVSEGIGEYGGATALAAPIERILAEPILPPTSARRAPTRSTVIGARSLAAPLTLSGLSPSLGTLFARAARKAGHPLLVSSASPRASGHPPQPLVPGAAVAVGLSSGDLGISAIGTVAYADGPNVWLFAHLLDGAGRRALFLQDAFIHTVVNNPIGAPEVSTYKLGSPGNDVGTVSSDSLNAVAGTLGALPPNYPLRVTARDLDTGRARSLSARVADEGDVGRPAGPSELGLAAAAAVAQAATSVLGGAPARQTGEMCVAITLRERKRPIRLCQRYAVDGGGANALAGSLALDVAEAAALIDGYAFGVVHPTNVEIGVRIRRGLRQAFLRGASAPRRARPGQKVALRLKLRRTVTGERFTRTVRLRIPADIEPGRRTIKLTGTDADPGSETTDEQELSVLFDEEIARSERPPAQSVEQLGASIEALERYDGVTAKIGGVEIEAHREADLRISGEARLTLTVRR